MRSAAILTALLFATSACGGSGAPDRQNSTAAMDNVGAPCGIPDLAYHIQEKPQPILFLDEPRSSGNLEDAGGNFIGPAPPSEREQRVSRASNCLSEQAAKRGLRLSWPVTEIVN